MTGEYGRHCCFVLEIASLSTRIKQCLVRSEASQGTYLHYPDLPLVHIQHRARLTASWLITLYCYRGTYLTINERHTTDERTVVSDALCVYLPR
jgi:hypothetical protein